MEVEVGTAVRSPLPHSPIEEPAMTVRLTPEAQAQATTLLAAIAELGLTPASAEGLLLAIDVAETAAEEDDEDATVESVLRWWMVDEADYTAESLAEAAQAFLVDH